MAVSHYIVFFNQYKAYDDADYHYIGPFFSYANMETYKQALQISGAHIVNDHADVLDYMKKQEGRVTLWSPWWYRKNRVIVDFLGNVEVDHLV